jgi:hypothetical protein
MNPRAMLIGDAWKTRTMVFGKKKFIFHGSEPKEVPVAVAITLQKKRESGKDVFKIEGLPKVIKAVHPMVEGLPTPVIKNEVIKAARQRKLVECLS